MRLECRMARDRPWIINNCFKLSPSARRIQESGNFGLFHTTKLLHMVLSTRLAKSLPLNFGPATSIALPLTDVCRPRHLTLSFFPLASAGLPSLLSGTFHANCKRTCIREYSDSTSTTCRRSPTGNRIPCRCNLVRHLNSLRTTAVGDSAGNVTLCQTARNLRMSHTCVRLSPIFQFILAYSLKSAGSVLRMRLHVNLIQPFQHSTARFFFRSLCLLSVVLFSELF